MTGQPTENAGDDGEHFTGTITEMLFRYLRHLDPALIDVLLSRSGETRSVEELTDHGTWSSYAQVRKLLEAAQPMLEGHGGLQRVALNSIEDIEQPASAVMMQDAGSLAAMFRDIRVVSSYIASLLIVESTEVGPTEWVIEQRFKDGFEPFPAYCEFGSGLIASTPTLFGIPAATVVHEACQCDGAPVCVFRVTCEVIDEQRQRADFFETRARLLTAQIETLQQTVGHLVSTDDVAEVLRRVIGSVGNAVQASSFVLAIAAAPPIGRHVHGRGVADDVARAIADELLAADATMRDAGNWLVVDVRSMRQHYGLLVAIRPDGQGFLTHERVVLQAYGRLAAVALDSATAVDEARRQTNSAVALLDLSTALSDIEAVEDTIATVVAAVPRVIDCDQAAIVLLDDAGSGRRVAIGHGFDAADTTRLDARLMSDTCELSPSGLRAIMTDMGAADSAATPILLDGAPTGWLLVAVEHEPVRLASADVHGRLAGLAAQASTAISNARRLGQIRHQALYDGLTGLPNRTLILDRAEQMLARARRHNLPTAALFLDIDGFKDVNDTLGHEAGDQLLQAVASRLEKTLRQADTIGRLGGDEFVVLVEGVSVEAGPEAVAERLLAVLKEPFVLDVGEQVSLNISASIGIAVGQRPSQLELLRDADVALYAAKASGKACFVVFQPEMQTAVRDRMELEHDLRNALAAKQYHLVYQPIVDLRTMEVTGVEALLRWLHPTRGLVQPDHFIPTLEDTSMIIDVGRWVLDEACRQTAEWQAQHWRIDISVNVSAKQLEFDGFVDDVRRALESSLIDPDSLILEITETAIMRDPDAVVGRLQAIKQLGVRIAIDDFGTGYSSLAYLSKFPVDCLKIDRSFVAAIADSSDAGALVNTLVQLGKTLGLETLAEGIEESEQMEYLQHQNCDSGQGFLFARPLDAGAVNELLVNQGLALIR